MYGTIASLHVKAGAEVTLRQTLNEEIAQHIYKADEGGDVFYLVIGFTSREAYVENANSSDQYARYLQFRALLAADPEWHDGEIVDSYLSVGS
jgi:hypothetical protein